MMPIQIQKICQSESLFWELEAMIIKYSIHNFKRNNHLSLNVVTTSMCPSTKGWFFSSQNIFFERKEMNFYNDLK